jgi:hypothetical protein
MDEFQSPYCYVGNDPLNFIDPDGAQVGRTDRGEGYTIYQYDDGQAWMFEELTPKEDFFGYHIYNAMFFRPSEETFKGLKAWLDAAETVANTVVMAAGGEAILAPALGTLASKAGEKIAIPIYRTFGGEARALGKFWSPINPKLYGALYRNLAGLPSTNTGSFTIKAMTKLNNIDFVGFAKPLDGNFGRLVPEVKLLNGLSVTAKNFWVNF